jgi:two-component system, cell cycle sensor histidine kinase and response regulator CckA
MTRSCPDARRDLIGIFVVVAALTLLLLIPHALGSPNLWSAVSAGGALLALGLFALAISRNKGELERSEARFQRLLEAAPDAVVITDRAGAIVFVNWQTERLFGYHREDLYGRTLEALLARPDAEGADRIDPSLTNTENIRAPEFLGRRKDGTEFAAEVCFSPLDTKDGMMVVNVIRDVSEDVRMERRRSVRHAVRRALARAADVKTATARVVQTVCEGLGFELATLWLVGPSGDGLRNFASWHTGSDESLDIQVLLREYALPAGVGLPGRVCREGEPVRIENLAPGGDCPRLAVAAREGFRVALGVPIAYDDKVFGMLELYHRAERPCDDHLVETMSRIGALLGQFFDRRAADERVYESEAVKAAILGAALDPIITLDHEGVVIACNPATETAFGHSRDRVQGKNLADLIATPPGTTPAHPLTPPSPSSDRGEGQKRRAWRFLNLGEDGLLGKRVETSAWRADGSMFPVEVVVVRIRPSDSSSLAGRPSAGPMFTAYVRDLTERKCAEEALRRSEEKFLQAQKLEALGRLGGGVAHDFNNLLTVVIASCDLLLADDRLHDELREAIEQILKVGERGAALTRQLLAFSRKQVIEARLLDLNTVITEMQKLLGRVIGEDIDLLTRLAPGLLPVKADTGQLEQVLMNLVVNARDAMPRGGELLIETSHVEAGAITDPQVPPGIYEVLSVRDTGVGMDAETISRIFEPFFTTKEVGKGTGLGLATVYGIVKQSGGHITVASEPGRGTTFKIYLPSAHEPESAQEKVAELPAAPARPTVSEQDEAATDWVPALPEHPESGEDGAETVLSHRDERPTRAYLALANLARPRVNGHGRPHQLNGRH